MHGNPALPAGFPNFPYAVPDAPKGGRVTLGSSSSFDNLNPMIVRGEPVQGIREFVVESLMARSQDEPFTLYGLIAETIDVPDDRSQVTFRLDQRARFSDGTPITAADILFSFEVLRDKGRPNYRTYYKKVTKAEAVSDHEVRFVFADGEDRELPLILGLMPVLPRHAMDAEKFEETTLAPLIGSGPYRIAAVDPGRSITYKRNPDYWAKDLPVNRGRFNFDEIRFEYYREGSTLFEAFKTGAIDLRNEDDPATWAKGYDFPAARDGRVHREEIAIGLPAGMTGLVFNTRRPVFADERVRQALILLFNFEWVNKSFFHGLYKRSQSYFERSMLSSAGKPADERERTLLGPFANAVLPEIMDGTWRAPESDGTPHNRANARKAYEMLEAAGYALQGGRLVQTKTGNQLNFEILASNTGQERLLGAFVGDLAKLGIKARMRVVDSAQYQSRLKDYDFDMIQFTWPSSLSPGNEQLFRWSSRVADQPGSYNYAGVENPAADAMITAMLAAHGNEEFVSAVRALDRVLLSGHYVIPLFYPPAQWIASWKRLSHPEAKPLFGFNLDTWWVSPQN
ncbi:extracellular solute-binding protein [uncultured Hyphomicrobium sp.]|uniref:extracellular solute-binding protein n=1 Tax=uncultured Hyphomicrobium sp. TaxID=194373 RepID=UPI0025F26BAF|nr:extracellular solute-binding protein [uncultured Hyphomicrobium sp.]